MTQPDTEAELGNTVTNSARIRRFVFTLNNWTEEEYDTILKWADTNNTLYIIGKEKGEQGTKHLQGYIEKKKCCKI